MSEKFKKARVLVIGDIIYDRYWFTEVTRISPEAPVPIAQHLKEDMKIGGAANVAANCSSLGANTMVIGCVGDDYEGNKIKQELDRLNVKNKLLVLKKQSSIIKHRIISQNQHILRIDFDNGYIIKPSDAIYEIVKSKINSYDVIILSDYAKGTLININRLIKLCRDLKKIIIVDPKGNDFSKYKNASILKPNMNEFKNIVGECLSENEINQKGLKLCQTLNLDHLLITRGERGMKLISGNKEILNINASKKDVFDVTGAGDTVIATLGTAIGSGFDIKEALNIANLSAGIAVSRFGTTIVQNTELFSTPPFLKNSNGISHSNLIRTVNKLKKEGKKIIMTNGCFDILHEGHVRYLKEAKNLGDILIIALNSDKSVKKIKGKDRPVNPVSSRLYMLNSYDFVDYVTVFNDETPEKIITKILPDVLVKAGDYNLKNIIGGSVVKKNGGLVKILPYFEGYSTTNIINKIKE